MKRVIVEVPFHMTATNKDYVRGDILDVDDATLAKIRAVNINMVSVLPDVVEVQVQDEPEPVTEPVQDEPEPVTEPVQDEPEQGQEQEEEEQKAQEEPKKRRTRKAKEEQ